MIAHKNLVSAFGAIDDYWSPKVIGSVNGQLLKAAKLKGQLVWHSHDEEEELFYVVKGALRIEFESHAVEMECGDFLTIPQGVRHNPVAENECWVLLIEPASTKHTGNEVIAQTKTLEQQMA